MNSRPLKTFCRPITVMKNIRKRQKVQEIMIAAELGNRTIAFTNWMREVFVFLFHSETHTKWRLGLICRSAWREMILKFKWRSFMQPVLRKLQLLKTSSESAMFRPQPKKSAKKLHWPLSADFSRLCDVGLRAANSTVEVNLCAVAKSILMRNSIFSWLCSIVFSDMCHVCGAHTSVKFNDPQSETISGTMRTCVTYVKVKAKAWHLYSAINDNCSFHGAVHHRLGRTCSL